MIVDGNRNHGSSPYGIQCPTESTGQQETAIFLPCWVTRIEVFNEHFNIESALSEAVAGTYGVGVKENSHMFSVFTGQWDKWHPKLHFPKEGKL